jgi:hypothetical protein
MITNKYPTHPNTKNSVDRGETCEGFLPYDVRYDRHPSLDGLAAILCLRQTSRIKAIYVITHII